MKGSDFIFDCVNLLYYKCHKINLNCGGSYIDSPDQIKTTTTKKNPINDDDKSFQSFAAVAFNHEEIGKYQQRTLKIEPFINKCNWKRINYPSGKDVWKNFEKKNQTLALNVLYVEKMPFKFGVKMVLKCLMKTLRYRV